MNNITPRHIVESGVETFRRDGVRLDSGSVEKYAPVVQSIIDDLPEPTELVSPSDLEPHEYSKMLGRVASHHYGSDFLTIDEQATASTDAAASLATKRLKSFHEDRMIGFTFVEGNVEDLSAAERDRMEQIVNKALALGFPVAFIRSPNEAQA